MDVRRESAAMWRSAKRVYLVFIVLCRCTLSLFFYALSLSLFLVLRGIVTSSIWPSDNSGKVTHFESHERVHDAVGELVDCLSPFSEFGIEDSLDLAPGVVYAAVLECQVEDTSVCIFLFL